MSTTSRYAELFSNFGFKNDRLLDGFEKKHQRKWQNIEGNVLLYYDKRQFFSSKCTTYRLDNYR